MRMEARALSKILAVGSILLFGFTVSAQLPTEGADEQWDRTVISIEFQKFPTNTPSPLGTGFLIGTTNYLSILVTAKHVINGVAASERGAVIYRYPSKSGDSGILIESGLRRDGYGECFFHPTADVACRLISSPTDHAMITIPMGMLLAKSRMRSGARTLVAGFPAGLRNTNGFRPLLRQGIISRIDPDRVVIDSPIFPGNSGSPAIYVPILKLNPNQFGMSSIPNDMLVGVVSSVIQYRWPIVTGGTNSKAVTNEFSFDSMGLCFVEPADRIAEVIAQPDFIRLRDVVSRKTP